MSNLLRFKDNCISLEDIYDNDDALCDFCAVASGNGGSGDCSNYRCIDGIRKWLDMPFAYTYSDTESFLLKFDDPNYQFNTEEIKKMCSYSFESYCFLNSFYHCSIFSERVFSSR